MKTYHLTAPLTKQDVAPLRAGDIVYLSGEIYTARDAAHERFRKTLEKGEKLPVDLTNETIFYAGPTPTKPGRVIGSIAPTTSMRIDGFVEMMFKQGMVAMIGKGDRHDYVAQLCGQYGGVYFLSIGGASALISKDVKKCTVVAYDDLGTESVKRLVVENLRLIVGYGPTGDDLFKQEIPKYAK